MTVVVAGILALFALHLAWTWMRAASVPRRSAGTAPVAAGPASVCIVVPCWNDADVLLGTLEALELEVAGARAPVEVVVVAGGADDGYERAWRFTEAKGTGWHVLRQGPRGKNAALNGGIATCGSDIVVFLDADTRVAPGWLDALTAPIRAGDADATSGRFAASRPTTVARIFEMDQLVSQGVHGANVLFGGGSIAVHRRVLDALGGRLPEDVVVGVDWDLSERVARAGFRRRFVPSARVVTEVPQTWGEYWRTEVRWRRAFLAACLRRWREAADVRAALDLVHGSALQAALLIGPAALPLVGAPFGLAGEGFLLWSGFAVWLVGRHLSRALVAYRAERDASWLAMIPAYAWAYCVSAAASLVGLASLGRLDPHFKGRRSARAS